jgi:hypothetical protein
LTKIISFLQRGWDNRVVTEVRLLARELRVNNSRAIGMTQSKSFYSERALILTIPHSSKHSVRYLFPVKLVLFFTHKHRIILVALKMSQSSLYDNEANITGFCFGHF